MLLPLGHKKAGVNMAQQQKKTNTSKTKNYQKEPMNELEAEIAITALHATGKFSVLRKLNLDQEPGFTYRSVQGAKIALCIDTETTGLDHAEDKIIELGIVAFEFNPITAEIIRIPSSRSDWA